jgi:hypothetical protein
MIVKQIPEASKIDRGISQRYLRLATSAVWILIGVGVIRAVWVLIDGAKLLTHQFATSRPEAFILLGVQQLSQRLPLYHPALGEQPFTVHVYNPLTYLPAGLFGRFFDADLQSLLVAGRVVSYMATLILLFLLVKWVWNQSREWKAAAFAAVAILFFQEVTLTDFFRLRPESPGLLFTFVGMTVFLSGYRNRLLVAAASFFIAFLFKQSFVAAPIAVFCYLLWQRDAKNLVRFTAYLGGMLVVFYFCMVLITGRNHFDHTVLSMAVNDIRPPEMVRRFLLLFKSQWGLVLALPIALTMLIRRREHHVLVIYFFVCLVWTLYSVSKVGANLNYFSELMIVAILLISLCLGAVGQRHTITCLTMMAVLAASVLSRPASGIKVYTRPDLTPYIEEYSALPGRKLITHEDLAIHVGDVVGFDWFLLSLLQEDDLVNLDPIIENISRGHYSVVVLNRQTHSPEFEQRLVRAVANGPYTQTYVDNLIGEWRRRPTTGADPGEN